jgi:hypothetical protein
MRVHLEFTSRDAAAAHNSSRDPQRERRDPMAAHHRLALGSVVAFALASSALAGEVSFQLTSVTTEICTEVDDGWVGTYWSCGSPAPVPLSPSAPQGPGSTIDLDTVGNFISGTVFLEAHDLDGAPVPAWSRTLARTSEGGIESTAESGAGPWGAGGAYASFGLTRFASQADFDGEIWIREESIATDPQGVNTLTVRSSRYEFSSVPGSSLVCAGERLYLDFDGDGEEDSRDHVPDWIDARFGSGVDENGLSIAQFCGAQALLACRRADFRNDEPRRKKPGDCFGVGTRRNASCQPTEFAAATPIGALRSCRDLPLFDDTDGDGEPDATDGCPNTPPGTGVDGAGCSNLQFCEAQPVLSCRRADFRNDEPGLKRPRDCAKSETQPRTCMAADAS